LLVPEGGGRTFPRARVMDRSCDGDLTGRWWSNAGKERVETVER
jgi:hypothetical protein